MFLYLSSFSAYIQHFADIRQTELFTIYKDLMLTKEMDIIELFCYWYDSSRCINLIKGPIMMFHVYVVFIQDIKDLIK